MTDATAEGLIDTPEVTHTPDGRTVMKRMTHRSLYTTLLVTAFTLLSTGVAEARIALNHNETVLDIRP
jgi:hypothetical protein